MNLTYVFEHRFSGTPDGAVWTSTTNEEAFWDRYLSVFDGVTVVARVRPVSRPRPEWRRADGRGVAFIKVPYYQGPLGFISCAPATVLTLRKAILRSNAVCFRVPSHLSICCEHPLNVTSQPYGLEVVGDPCDAFAPGVNRHPLRSLFRQWYVRGLKRQARRASAVSYVARYLSNRYPASESAFQTNYSDAQLSDEAFVGTPGRTRGYGLRLVTVSFLDQHYKGTEVLLDSVAHCRRAGLPLSLTIVGDGRLRPQFERYAASLGISHTVTFTGAVAAGAPVREYLDNSDIFVLSSLTEGLSRALLEAMARGLPCIASCVGGTPDLLEVDELVRPGDILDLASRISTLTTDRPRMQRLSARNVLVARRFHEANSSKERVRFCSHLKTATANWLRRGVTVATS